MKIHSVEEDVYILAIESSCDETAAAVVKNGREVLSNVISSQIALHTLYGGVVPEIASRKHVEVIAVLTEQALRQASCTREDIDAVAVTYAPGLIGAVLVGLSFAKSMAFALGVPPWGASDPGAPCPGPYRRQLSGLPGAGATLPGTGHLRGKYPDRGCAGLYGSPHSGCHPG